MRKLLSIFCSAALLLLAACSFELNNSSSNLSRASVTGTNGSITVSDMTNNNLTISYQSGTQLNYARLYVSEGNGTGLILANADMNYSNGNYTYSLNNGTFTSGAKIYICVLVNNGAETCVPQGVLSDTSSWAYVTYGENTASGTQTSTTSTTTSGSSGLVSGATYKILAKCSGKSLDVADWSTNPSTNIHQWEYYDQSNQHWIVTQQPDGYWTIVSEWNGYSLDCENWGTTSGTNVLQWYNNAQDNQKWEITQVSDGYYKVINKYASLALDVNGASSDNGANVQIWEWNGSDAQLWSFTNLSGSNTVVEPETPVTEPETTTTEPEIVTGNTGNGNPGYSGLYTNSALTYANWTEINEQGYQPTFAVGEWEGAWIGVNSDTNIATIVITEGNWHGATLGQKPTTVSGSSYYNFSNVSYVRFYIKSSSIYGGNIQYFLQGTPNGITATLDNYGVGNISEWTLVTIPVSAYQSSKITTAIALGVPEGSCSVNDELYVRQISFLDSNYNEVTNIADTISYASSRASVDGADTTRSNVGANGSYFVASNPSNPDSFTTLVWSDEFNGNSVDTTNNWVYDVGNGDWGWGNNEQEYYTAGNNAVVANGALKITAKSDLTSTRMKTYQKKSFLYGKIEARMRFDEGTGSWPAFWMLGNNLETQTWPRCGEIDIMEHANTAGYINNTLHWNYEGSAASDPYAHAEFGTNTQSNYWNNIDLDVTQWHTYTCVWTDSTIYMYVDGTLTYQMTYSGATGGDCFNKPFFILFNFAMGGLYVSVTDTAAFTNLPWNMFVDYVRVYQ